MRRSSFGRCSGRGPSTIAASIICSWLPRRTTSNRADGSVPAIQSFAAQESGPRSTRSPRLKTRSCSRYLEFGERPSQGREVSVDVTHHEVPALAVAFQAEGEVCARRCQRVGPHRLSLCSSGITSTLLPFMGLQLLRRFVGWSIPVIRHRCSSNQGVPTGACLASSRGNPYCSALSQALSRLRRARVGRCPEGGGVWLRAVVWCGVAGVSNKGCFAFLRGGRVSHCVRIPGAPVALPGAAFPS